MGQRWWYRRVYGAIQCDDLVACICNAKAQTNIRRKKLIGTAWWDCNPSAAPLAKRLAVLREELAGPRPAGSGLAQEIIPQGTGYGAHLLYATTEIEKNV